MNLKSIINLLRVRQWTKNAFVLFPLIFSGKFCAANAAEAYWLTAFALAAFCCWSSAVYIFNDIIDVKADRIHPRKQKRPIAAGEIGIPAAGCIAVALIALPALIFSTGLNLPAEFWGIGAAYLINNLLYCVLFRSVPILDIFSLALGIVLRILSGCAILNVTPTFWIIACGFALALFMGLGKRRMELDRIGEEKKLYRPALAFYSAKRINFLLNALAVMTIGAYAGYTLAPSTAELHNTVYLAGTIPFVIFGVIRYILLTRSGKYDGPDEAIAKDPISLCNLLLWVIAVISILVLSNR